MSLDQRGHDLHRTLVSKGFKRDRAAVDTLRYVGQLEAAGHSVSVAITFADLEFARLPTVTLLDPKKEAANVVAHLTVQGDLCFARNEDYVLDRYNVGGTVLLCLKLATMGVERALTHKNLEDEIANEFPQHWQGNWIYYDIARKGALQAKLYSVPRLSAANCLLLADREAVLRRLIADPDQRREIFSAAAPAFVLRTEKRLTFKKDFRQPETLRDFLDWLASLDIANRQGVVERIAQPYPNMAAIFINAPNGCIGINVRLPAQLRKAVQRREGLAQLLTTHVHKTPVERLSGERIDLDHVFSRNMNNKTPLVGKRIALIGCGTIGSHVAKLLVQSGASHKGGTLLLLDNQALKPGNIGRHFLSMPHVGEPKAHALKAELSRGFPDANIVALESDALRYLSNLHDYDLIIDATGEEAISFSINDYFVRLRAKEHAPDVLHVWLFGNGDAAQAILVTDFEHACLKCQKPVVDEKWHNDPMKGGAKAVPTAAACGEGLYIAYGVAAPVMAAALALELALDWNSGDAKPLLRTVRVNTKSTVEVKNKSPSRSMGCPACGEFQPK